jgi:predicted transcriptional regulator
MALTLRIPAELDARLETVAAAQHSSKSAVVLRALEEHVARELKTQTVIALLDETSQEYSELITRLEDA